MELRYDYAMLKRLEVIEAIATRVGPLPYKIKSGSGPWNQASNWYP